MSYKAFFAAMRQAGISADERGDLCLLYSEGRTASLKNLHPIEYSRLLAHVNGLNGEQQPVSVKKMRSKVLGLACDYLEMKLPDGGVNWERFNAWMLKYSMLKKALNKYTKDELPDLVTQFESIKKKTIAGKRRKMKISE